MIGGAMRRRLLVLGVTADDACHQGQDRTSGASTRGRGAGRTTLLPWDEGTTVYCFQPSRTRSARRALGAAVRGARDLGGQAGILLHGREAIVARDDPLGVEDLVTGLHDEQRGLLANLGVLVRGDLDPLQARGGSTLAHDQHASVVRHQRLVQPAYLLVDTAEQRLVLADSSLTFAHAGSSWRGSSSAATSAASSTFSTIV